MATPDKIEAVKKVSEAMSTEGMGHVEEMERMSSTKEQFQTLIDSTRPVKPSSFERIDTKAFATEDAHSTEKLPVFADENVSAQKRGKRNRPGREKTGPTGNRRNRRSFCNTL